MVIGNIFIIESSVSSNRRRLPSFLGKYPTKRNLSQGRPERVKAAIAADGPGIDSSLIPARTASRTRWNPGSDINGVPASETKAIFLLFFKSSMTFGVLVFSLKSLKEIAGLA